ncbi:MAG: vWA domain-containing protein [Spartobacteria bacterium]
MNSPHNRHFLLRELQALAAQVTGEEVCVIEGEAGCCWSWNWQDRVITVAPEYLGEKAADVCRAILLHEGAHCAITRIHHILAAERRHLYQDLLNVLEDFRIESWLAAAFPGCAGWLAAANGLVYRSTHSMPWPASYQIQFLRGLLEWTHMDKFPEEGPADCVKEALKETRKAVLEQTACHPLSARGRGAAIETMKAQQRMLEIFDRAIHPVWERLVGFDECEGRSRVTTLREEEGIAVSCPRNKAISSKRKGANAGGGRMSRGETLPRCYLERAYSLSNLIDPLAEDLIRLLETTARQKPLKGQRQGDRINMRAAMQAEADPRLRDKVWERRLIHTRFDPLIILALDCSHSMEGEKFDSAYEAIVLLSEVCLRSGLPLALWIFNRDARQVVSPYALADSDFHRRQIDRVREACGGSTAMHRALEGIQASPELEQFAHPVVFVVGDGDPDCKSASVSSINRLEAANVPVFGIGVGEEMRQMAALFSESVLVPNVSVLAKTLGRILRKTLLNQIAATGAQPNRRAA